MNWKSVIPAFAFIVVAMMIASLGVVGADEEYDSVYVKEAPIIDGSISEDEWGNAVIDDYSYLNGDFVVGFYNDGDMLYAFADLTWLQTEDNGSWCAMGFDTTGDKYIDWQNYSYNDDIVLLSNTSFSINSVGGSVAMGFEKTWNEDGDKHYVYEFAIPLDNIGFEDEDDFDDPVVLAFAGANNTMGTPTFFFPEDSQDIVELNLAYTPDDIDEGVVSEAEYGYGILGLIVLTILGGMQLIWLNRDFAELSAWQQWVMMNDRWIMLWVGVGGLVFMHIGIDFIGQYAYDLVAWIHSLIGYSM